MAKKKNKKGSAKAGLKRAGNIALASIELVGAAALSVVAFEGVGIATKGAIADAKLVKEAIDPTPVQVKRGRFGKRETVKCNPLTGKISPYTGSKKPINTKPIIIRKEA